MNSQKTLSQYFTPRWAAEAIVENYFGDLPVGATVVEPSCGDGRFLFALPQHIKAIGVEIDPVQAAKARELTGRLVIDGDFLTTDLPLDVDAVIGNPPFVADTVAAFLERSHKLLKDGGKCGFILPSYILQTSTKLMRFAKNWSIQTDQIPRNLFPGLSLPITFTVFTKDKHRKLHGFFLYRETDDVYRASKAIRQVLVHSKKSGSVWRQAVNDAFDLLGEDAVALPDLYKAIQHKPSTNGHCDQQVRKILQTYPEFIPVERGRWSRRPVNQSHALLAA